MVNVCECCGTPETETALELCGHGDGMLVCARGCPRRHTAHRRRYAELTPALLDALETRADEAEHAYTQVEYIETDVLHALIRVARVAPKMGQD